MASQDVSQTANRHALISCLLVAILFMIVRTYARSYKIKSFPLELEDLTMYFALASFATLCGLYLSCLPVIYGVEAVEAGTRAPWPTILQDSAHILKKFFAVQIFFWLTLWAVKCSLMFMFQKLTTRVKFYVWIWRGVMAFSLLTFVGCLITHLLSCSSFHAWFTLGSCATSRDATAKAVSLWFALAVDLITDLMIMAVPLHILYNLQMTKTQKYSVGIVFGVGLITMVVAVIRVVSLDSTVSAGEVDVYWLIMWGGIEGCAAIITGSLPSLAVFIRGKVIKSRTTGSYGGSGAKNGHSMQTWRLRSKARCESVQLDDVETGKTDSAVPEPAAPALTRPDTAGSTKSLIKGGILITQSWGHKWQKNDSTSSASEIENKSEVERRD